MNKTRFDWMLSQQFREITQMLNLKGTEYVGDFDEHADHIDVLGAFRAAAALQEIPITKALSGMMAKHTISIYDMLMEPDPHVFTEERWLEKINDHINYLILLRAILTETWDESKPEWDGINNR